MTHYVLVCQKILNCSFCFIFSTYRKALVLLSEMRFHLKTMHNMRCKIRNLVVMSISLMFIIKGPYSVLNCNYSKSHFLTYFLLKKVQSTDKRVTRNEQTIFAQHAWTRDRAIDSGEPAQEPMLHQLLGIGRRDNSSTNVFGGQMVIRIIMVTKTVEFQDSI